MDIPDEPAVIPKLTKRASSDQEAKSDEAQANSSLSQDLSDLGGNLLPYIVSNFHDISIF